MNNEFDPGVESTGLEEHREELAAEFLRVARREASSRHRRSSVGQYRLALAIGALALAVPAGIAGAHLFGGSEVPGTPLFGDDGRYPDCPIEESTLAELRNPSDYAKIPGYPIAGCPTVEEYEADPAVQAEFDALEQGATPAQPAHAADSPRCEGRGAVEALRTRGDSGGALHEQNRGSACP